MAKKKIDTNAVLEFLAANPKSTVFAIAEHLDVSVDGVRSKMHRMRDAGQVVNEIVDRVCYYSAIRCQPFGVSANAKMLNSLLAKARSNWEGL
ncbi:hypothetical protein [Pseudocitrobacter vendiensis]|uniref:ArsR family transcriptional regulator n=1 Tax=Pseudocitrobacter vendiensis TaxID=2488306 RepID=A0ABN8TEJ3_9ENTR|nr:hypothetical protein [Pseudocitrobacter vendiensis]CAH6661280.1 hypothetical protein FBBNIHIM_19410 [Pseudocitrobacter vendiensis]